VKRISIALCLVLLYFSCAAFADDTDLDKYISKFSYQERKDMKITSKELLPAPERTEGPIRRHPLQGRIRRLADGFRDEHPDKRAP